MLNLLFISDSPKIEYIKKVLQPVLKVIIDVVPDFDHGLKDVFEKRPATVCIQDQIAGVTGESVARHIQMLLGTGAPTFILIHDGNSKAKQIRGLFEYIVDLNQPEDKLADEIQNTLKALIGDQWDKVYVPPRQTAASIKSSSSVLSPESRKDADKLVDDFLSDLETTGFSAVNDSVSLSHPEFLVEQTSSPVLQTTADELAEMLLEQANQARQVEVAAEKPLVDDKIFKEEPKLNSPVKSPDVNASASTDISDKPAKTSRTKSAISRQKQDTKPDAVKPVDLTHPASQLSVAVGQVAQPTPVVPAEFVISNEKVPVPEQIPDDLLMAFEKNYRSESNSLKRVIITGSVVLFIVALGGWYYVKQNPRLLVSLKQQAAPASKPVAATTAVNPALQPVSQPLLVEQKTAQVVVEKTSAISTFPSFIPREGHDKTFAVKKPGWERYVKGQIEFRLFSADGKAKALQILASKGNVVSDDLVKTVMAELAGSADYKINARENKSGFLVLRGVVAQKADVLFYKKDGTIRAFVISLY